MAFKDLFSAKSSDYSQFRPTYPDTLYQEIRNFCQNNVLALDCACGSGQASFDLVKYFDQVIALDASFNQVKNSKKSQNLYYGVSLAESIPLKDRSCDLITVAQALHWFNFDKFYTEVKRILKSKGIFAAWTYDIPYIKHEKFDENFREFYGNFLKPYWDSERKHIDLAYQTIPFPFMQVKTIKFTMVEQWSLKNFLNYTQTWSAVGHYEKQKQENPVEKELYPKVKDLWPIEEVRTVMFDLTLKACLLD